MENAKTRDTILFIHGAWHGAWCWEKYFIPEFTKRGFHCVAFNLPKHDKPGNTKGINTLSLNDYVEALKEEVQKLDQVPIIIGHSMGGLVLQKYLETETCQKAILLAPAPPTGVLRTTLNFLKKSYTLPNLLTFNLYGLINTAEKSKWAFFSEDLPNEELQEYTKNLCGESYRAFLDMLYPNVKVNNHLKIPMLVMGARNDNIFTVQEMETTAKKYNADLIIVEDIAHDMMLDANREKVSSAILEWIENQNDKDS